MRPTVSRIAQLDSVVGLVAPFASWLEVAVPLLLAPCRNWEQLLAAALGPLVFLSHLLSSQRFPDPLTQPWFATSSTCRLCIQSELHGWFPLLCWSPPLRLGVRWRCGSLWRGIGPGSSRLQRHLAVGVAVPPLASSSSRGSILLPSGAACLRCSQPCA